MQLGTSLTIANVATILKQFKDSLNCAKSQTANTLINIDLGQIQQIDSAGIALLLELKNLANKANYSVEFTNLPDNIVNWCNLYRVVL